MSILNVCKLNDKKKLKKLIKIGNNINQIDEENNKNEKEIERNLRKDIKYIKRIQNEKNEKNERNLSLTHQINNNLIVCNRNINLLNKNILTKCQNGIKLNSGDCVKENNQIKCFPSFIIAGSMKSGTGALLRWLGMHPNIQVVLLLN